MSLLPQELLAWIEAETGTALTHVEELTGGASRNSYIVAAGNGEKYFLRVDAGHGPLSGTPFTLEREYGVLRLLNCTAVPIPRVLAYSPGHKALLMEFIAGHTSYQKTGTEQEEAIIRHDVMSAVLALQQVDPVRIDALGAVSAAPLAQAVSRDLAVWQALYETRVSIREPMIDFALNWLLQSVPSPQVKPVIVHGDVGPGNFLVAEGRVRALIDWELVRVGHPLEDVACIIARGLGAPFGRAREHIENYERLSGRTIDYAELDYALVLVLTRWMIGIQMALSRPSARQNVPMLFAFRQINGGALIDALCRCYGVTTGTENFVIRQHKQCSAVIEYSRDCLEQLGNAAHLTSADKHKLQGISDLISYLASFIGYGPETYDKEECERISAVLGRPARTVDEGMADLCTYARTVRAEDARSLIEYLRWRSAREHIIMKASLGERADNTISYE